MVSKPTTVMVDEHSMIILPKQAVQASSGSSSRSSNSSSECDPKQAQLNTITIDDTIGVTSPDHMATLTEEKRMSIKASFADYINTCWMYNHPSRNQGSECEGTPILYQTRGSHSSIPKTSLGPAMIGNDRLNSLKFVIEPCVFLS